MTDEQILDALFARDEAGLEALRGSCGALAEAVAQRITGSREDAEECVQDGLMELWNSIPPQRPESVKHYFLRLVRNRALDRWRGLHREKRGGGALPLILDELDRDIPSNSSVEDEVAEKLLAERINTFLAALPRRERDVFLRRYYWVEDPETVAAGMGLTKSNVSVILFRVRKKLKAFLKKEELL